ncbi:plasmid pRiA4b ORF-3 family protein [Bradyrhizobium sp. USDA 223]|uniref:plasmid pRiA4b ORF-3 family protein n=1 Tax=Bradyrhizobium sp. USDA 223 TaxID=3156306 RepID=UPI00384FDC19
MQSASLHMIRTLSPPWWCGFASRASPFAFGDSWDHVIKLEKWFDNTTMEGLPLLLEAAGRCPPEDVGGAPGYADYLDAIGDPTHPEHENMHLSGPNSSIPTSSTGRRSRPPSTHCPEFGSRGLAPRGSNKRQASIKRAAELRLPLTSRARRWRPEERQ